MNLSEFTSESLRIVNIAQKYDFPTLLRNYASLATERVVQNPTVNANNPIYVTDSRVETAFKNLKNALFNIRLELDKLPLDARYVWDRIFGSKLDTIISPDKVLSTEEINELNNINGQFTQISSLENQL